MVCGLGLGFLLVFVQAEHVCCSWATRAWSSQNNGYAGFSLQDGRPRKLDGSYPQNQVRQAFVSPRSMQRSSLGKDTAVLRGSGGRLPTGSYAPALYGQAQSSGRLQSSLVSKPSWQPTSSTRVNAQAVPKPSFSLSTAIASGSSVDQQSKAIPGLGKKAAWSAQWGTQHAGRYPSSSSASFPSPSRGTSYSSPGSRQSAVLKPSSVAQMGSTATLFSPVGPAPHGTPARMQTYARAAAKKVPSNRKAEAQTQSPNGRISVQGTHHFPLSISSTVGASAPGFAPVSVYKIPQSFGGSPIRRLRDPSEQDEQTPTAPPQKAYYKPQLPSVHPESKWSRVSLRRRL